MNFYRKDEVLKAIVEDSPNAHYPSWYLEKITKLKTYDLNDSNKSKVCTEHENKIFNYERMWNHVKQVAIDGLCEENENFKKALTYSSSGMCSMGDSQNPNYARSSCINFLIGTLTAEEVMEYKRVHGQKDDGTRGDKKD